MYICLLKAYLGLLKVSLWIYLVFGFFWCYLAFSRVDLALFADDHLATLIVTCACARSELAKSRTAS